MIDRKRLSLGVRLVGTAVLLATLLYLIDIDALRASTARIDYRWLLAAAAILVFLRLMLAYRWYYIMRRQGLAVGLGETVRTTLVAAAFGPLAPAGLGSDLFRGYRFANKYGGAAAIAAGILLDRAIGVYSMLLVAGVGAAVIWYQGGADGWLLALIVLQAAIVAGWAVGIALRDRVARHGGVPFRSRLLDRFWRSFVSFFVQLTDVALLRRIFPGSLAISVVIQLVRCLMIYCLYRAFAYDLGLVHFVIYVPLLFLVMFLPVSVGGLGVRESALVFFFTPLGVPAAVSFSVGIVAYGLQLLFSAAVVAAWLLSRLAVEGTRLSRPGR